MSSTNVPVVDKQIVKTYDVNNVDIRIVNLNLGRSVDVNAVMKNNGQFVEVKNFHIEGQEYDNWGASDTYLEDLVLSKLDLHRKAAK